MTNLRQHPLLREADRAFYRALDGIQSRKTVLALAKAHDETIYATQRAILRATKPLKPRY